MCIRIEIALSNDGIVSDTDSVVLHTVNLLRHEKRCPTHRSLDMSHNSISVYQFQKQFQGFIRAVDILNHMLIHNRGSNTSL